MNTFKITALLCHIKLTPRELEECKVALVSLHSNNANQHKFFEYCFEYKMAPWIYLQLQKHDFLQLFDDDIKELFKNTHEDVKKENENRNKVAKQFLQAFHENNIDVIILKGNSFIHTIYKDTGYKKMNDFDILIKFEDWPKIEQIYYDFGYIALDFYGIPCKQLSPEYNLLHLILHLGVYKCGIRDCMDLFNLIQTTNINKEKLFAIIEKSKAKEKSFYALKMCNLCSPYIPSGWIEHLEVDSSSFIITRLKKRFEMFKETKDFHGSYNDYFQDIEKNVIHLYLFPHFHKRFKYLLKVIRLLYFPEMKDALKFIDKSHKPKLFNRMKARLLGPWFSFSMIAQEIGWKYGILLFVKMCFDTLISPINYFISKESYFQYLKRKGIESSKILKLVDNVQ